MNEAPAEADRMQCMEIHGGNEASDRSFQAPGINLHVNSTPYQQSSEGGGDLYYMTSCASGRITRLLLADVCGHGRGAAKLAGSLRDLLRRNVNRISQERFVESMNLEFGKLAAENVFATAIVATYFAPAKRLTLSVAGHPYPIYYRHSQQRWVQLDPQCVGKQRLGNLPLGIVNGSAYPSRTVEPEYGDMVLLYSDAFIESVERNEPLGMAGVVQLLNQMPNPQPRAVIGYLRDSLTAMAVANLSDDDATLMLGEFTKTGVRMRDNLLAPLRWLRGVGDRTRLRSQPN